MYSFDKKFLHLMGNKTVMKIGFLLHTFFCILSMQVFTYNKSYPIIQNSIKTPGNSGFRAT